MKNKQNNREIWEFGIGKTMKQYHDKLNCQLFLKARYFHHSILLPFSAYDFNYPLQLKQELITVEVTPEISNFDEGD